MTTATAKAKATTIDALALKNALDSVKIALPKTGMVVIGGGCVVASTSELRISVPLDGADFEPLMVNHAKLFAIAGVAVGKLKLKPAGTLLEVANGRGNWSLPTGPATIEPVPSGSPLIRLAAEHLRRMVNQCLPAVDDESSRYALGGVRIEIAGETAWFVATDGRRCHIVTAAANQDVDDRCVILPKAAATAIAGECKKFPHDSAQLDVSGVALIAEIHGTTIVATLLSGDYPRWRDVMPHDTAPAAVAGAGALLAAVRQAAIVTSETSKAVQFVFDDRGTIAMSGQSAESGTSSVTIDAEVSKSLRVRLDPTFVLEWLSEADPAVPVQIIATDSQSAVVLRHDDATGVLSPMEE